MITPFDVEAMLGALARAKSNLPLKSARSAGGNLPSRWWWSCKTNERLDQANLRLVQLGEDLSHRIVESEMRTATAITDLAGTVRDLVTSVTRRREPTAWRLSRATGSPGT